MTGDPDGIYYPELVAEGIETGEAEDGARWHLGDLALQVETIYGEHRLERYAEDIRREFKTLLQYRWARLSSKLLNGTRTH